MTNLKISIELIKDVKVVFVIDKPDGNTVHLEVLLSAETEGVANEYNH